MPRIVGRLPVDVLLVALYAVKKWRTALDHQRLSKPACDSNVRMPSKTKRLAHSMTPLVQHQAVSFASEPDIFRLVAMDHVDFVPSPANVLERRDRVLFVLVDDGPTLGTSGRQVLEDQRVRMAVDRRNFWVQGHVVVDRDDLAELLNADITQQLPRPSIARALLRFRLLACQTVISLRDVEHQVIQVVVDAVGKAVRRTSAFVAVPRLLLAAGNLFPLRQPQVMREQSATSGRCASIRGGVHRSQVTRGLEAHKCPT